MLFLKIQVLSVVLFNIMYTVNCFVDPVSLSLFGASIASMYLWLSSDNKNSVGNKVIKYIGQKVGAFEGCEDYWITSNIAGLEYELKSNVFGQPLAVNTIISAMRNHLRKDVAPKRPLVLSFHGGPGTGKNLIAQMILKNMFKKGDKSDYTLFFRSSIDFPLNSERDKYKMEIVTKIKEKVYECHRSIFVFDEVEKMPSGLLDVLSAFVKIGTHGDYDFRRAIFILLSNIGSEVLVSETLRNLRHNGGIREEMDGPRLNSLLLTSSYNMEGGFQKTGLVQNLGISHYVPFLPLERHHVIQCLEREVARLNQIMSNELVNQVLEELTFKPNEVPIFSAGGCKGVSETAVVLIERERRRKRRLNNEV